MEGQQQTILSLKEIPDKAIQIQHIYLCLFCKLNFYLSCKMKMQMALIFLKIHFYTQSMKIILHFFLNRVK